MTFKDFARSILHGFLFAAGVFLMQLLIEVTMDRSLCGPTHPKTHQG